MSMELEEEYEEEYMLQNRYLLLWQLNHIKKFFGDHSPQVERQSGNPMAIVFQTGEALGVSSLPIDNYDKYFCAYKVTESGVYGQLGPIVRFKSVFDWEFNNLSIFESNRRSHNDLRYTNWQNPNTMQVNSICYLGSFKSITDHSFYDFD